jgi:peptidoglycan/LPS O-acetylase OafA/YrhL
MSTTIITARLSEPNLGAAQKSAGAHMAGKNSKQRLNCIQAFRAVAVIVVVCAHLYGLETRYFHTAYMAPMRRYGWASVDLLFIISGIVISLIAEGKFRNRHGAVEFIYHRVTRVYPVFWFYFFIIMAVFYIAPEAINASTGHHAALIRSFFLIPSEFGNLLYQAWTLTYELWFYSVIFVFMLVIEERFLPAALASWALLVAVVNLCHLVPSTWYVMGVMTGPFVYEFIIGCVVFQIFKRSRLSARLSALCIVGGIGGMTGTVLVTIYRYNLDAAWIESSFWMRPIVCGPVGGLILLGAMGMERAGHLRFVKYMLPIGDWSYSIYLSHTIVIKLVGYLLRRLIIGLPAAIVYLDTVALPAVVVVGYLSYRFIERPVTRFFYNSYPNPLSSFRHRSLERRSRGSL